MSYLHEDNPLQVLGVNIVDSKKISCLSHVESELAPKSNKVVHFVNAFTISLASESESYRTLLNQSGLNLCDGKPVSWVARGLYKRKGVVQRRGPDFFEEAMLDRSCNRNHYLIGGSTETRDLMLLRLKQENPSLRIVGFDCPPFRELSDEELVQRVKTVSDSDADIVWVGLGTPKQDFESHYLSNATGKITIAVGAAFDFFSKSKPSAPLMLQRLGLEWLFRLLSEPGRLWKRYLLGNLTFLKVTVIASILKLSRKTRARKS